jgi:hypothetical protein
MKSRPFLFVIGFVFVALMVFSIVLLFATPYRAKYYNQVTSMDSLLTSKREEGKGVFCVSEIPYRPVLGNSFIPGLDWVLCFDTQAEADAEFANQRKNLR